MNSAAVILVVAALILTFAPYADVGNPQIEEIRQVEAAVQRVLPENVPALLQSGDGRPVMLVLYASWCGYCSKLMPRILQLMNEHKLDHVKPVFLSMDSQPRIFSKYLVRTKYYILFQPLMLQEIFYNNLPQVMAATGSGFNGAIPYVGFFSPDGKMLAEISGLVDKQDLLSVAETVKQSNARR